LEKNWQGSVVIIFRVVVSFGVARITFHVYVD
jgi:hypothetical protein